MSRVQNKSTEHDAITMNEEMTAVAVVNSGGNANNGGLYQCYNNKQVDINVYHTIMSSSNNSNIYHAIMTSSNNCNDSSSGCLEAGPWQQWEPRSTTWAEMAFP